MYICVDFDGTVVDHRYPEMGEPAPDAFKWLIRFQKYGAHLILFTMRSDGGPYDNVLSQAVSLLENNGVKLYAVNNNPAQREWTTSPKVFADIYIDDSAIGCPLIHPRGFARPCVDWKKVGPRVEHMLLSRR